MASLARGGVIDGFLFFLISHGGVAFSFFFNRDFNIRWDIVIGLLEFLVEGLFVQFAVLVCGACHGTGVDMKEGRDNDDVFRVDVVPFIIVGR